MQQMISNLYRQQAEKMSRKLMCFRPPSSSGAATEWNLIQEKRTTHVCLYGPCIVRWGSVLTVRRLRDVGRQLTLLLQLAAGAFSFLKDNVAMKASMGSSTTLDLSVECVGMLEKLMLAQAQECYFESAIAKESTPGVCAKISRQVGIYYEEALAALSVAPLNQHFDKNWLSHVQLKAALFYAEACYWYGLELHEKGEIAKEIARLKSGVSSLLEAKKSSSKGASQQLLDAINNLEANLNRNLKRAIKQNNRVYLMRVPAASSLPPLPAFSVVKPLSMDEVLDASKSKMFTTLVPHNRAQALSRYIKMVDDVIRTQAEKLRQASELARVRLKEMDLPESILALEGNFSLPAALKEDVEAVQVCGSPADLEGELQKLKDWRRVDQEFLVQIQELLQKEAADDAQFRSQFGTQWTQFSTLTKSLQDRLNTFAANLKQAAESDARIERSVRDNSALMSILDRHPIESALPALASPMMSLDANGYAIVGALKQSLRQLESLGAQRAGLEDMLKEMKRKDDILPKLMIFAGSREDLFRKEIAKYDHICQEISQNVVAQEQLLMQIQGQNDDFAAVFNLEDCIASRERVYKQIEAAIAKYREIKENIIAGLKFYDTLQDTITNIERHVITRNVQCGKMVEDVQRHVQRQVDGQKARRSHGPLAKSLGTRKKDPFERLYLQIQFDAIDASEVYASSGVSGFYSYVIRNTFASLCICVSPYMKCSLGSASRERVYKQIEAAIAKYREIKENIIAGLKFYDTLQDTITNIERHVITRNIHCGKMVEDVQRQFDGLKECRQLPSSPYWTVPSESKTYCQYIPAGPCYVCNAEYDPQLSQLTRANSTLVHYASAFSDENTSACAIM